MNKKDKESKKILSKMNTEKVRAEKKKEKQANKKGFKQRVSETFGKFKEYCIKDTSRTILLVAILIAVYIVLNLWIRTINLAQIDLTQGKLHSLTDQSKNIAQSVDLDITFYAWKYEENSAVVDLLKQYNAQNEKIKYQIVTSNDTELIQKYGFEDDYPSIIGESETGKISYINDSDLYTYDSSYNVVDLTEQKLTNAINNLTEKENTKVYFIGGNRTNYTTQSGIYYLSYYLQNEYYDVDTIDVVADPTIPEDCDILAIMGLASDLTETEANNICQYIDKGGDLIITNDIDYINTDKSMPNFQKVLDKYCISMPSNKIVQETSSNIVSGSNGTLVQSNVASDHEITRLMYNNNAKPILVTPGIIELDTSKMVEQNINATPILMSSDSAVLANLSTKSTEKDDESTYFVVGAAIQKTVESGDESRLVVFSSTSSFSDNSIDGQVPILAYNVDIILNSFAFAANKGELYSIRKTSAYTIYQPTEQQDKIVRVIITAVPVLIIIIGIYVWIKRRRLK